MAVTGAITVAFDEVFPNGAFLVSDVDQAKDWDLSTRENFVQRLVRDRDGKAVKLDGLEVKVWQVELMDRDPQARPDQRTVVVLLASPRQPVPPAPPDEDSLARVELVGMSMRLWVDRKLCRPPRQGDTHYCRARQVFEMWATDLRAPSGGRVKAAAANGRGEAG
jgi:hypothetical protein